MQNNQPESFNPAANPANSAAPTNPAQPTSAPAAAAPPPADSTEVPKPIKPKSKKKLIAIISTCVVSLALIISGVAFAIIHNLPEKVLLDAVSGFFSAENIELNGKYKIKSDSEYSSVESIDLDFSGAKSGIENTSEVAITINPQDGDPYSLTVNESFTDNGTLYLKVSDLRTIYDQMIEAGTLPVGSDFESVFEDIIGEIDGEWWEISIDTVLDGFEGLIAESDKTKYTETYQCVFNKVKEAESKKDDYVNLYSENRFLSSEKYTPTDSKTGLDLSEFNNSGDLYKLSFDAEKLTNFLNGTSSIVDANSIATCFNEISDSDVETTDIKREDVEEFIDKMPDIILSIKGWNHELKGIYLASKDTGEATETPDIVDCDVESDAEQDEEYIEDCISDTSYVSSSNPDYDMFATFSYPASLDISAPDGAKSIADVIKKTVQIVQTMWLQSFTTTDDATPVTIEDDTTIDIDGTSDSTDDIIIEGATVEDDAEDDEAYIDTETIETE